MVIPDSMKQQYIERRKADLQKLQTALNENDFSVIGRIGHQLKGNAATFGFNELEAIGIALEDAGDASDKEAAHQALVSLSSWLSSRT